MGKLSAALCVVNTALDDTSGVSDVFSEVLPASSERAPTAALRATNGSLPLRLGECYLDQSFLTRKAGEPGQG